jgi:hypothetical protein
MGQGRSVLDTEQIIAVLRSERDRVDQAIAALQGGSGRQRSASATSAGPRRGRRGPRHMSAEARRRISEAQKRRWAAQRKKK